MNNKDICERLYFTMIEDNNELINIDAVLSKVNLLMDNHLCSKLSYLQSGVGFPTELFLTKYFLKMDKDLKKYMVDRNSRNDADDELDFDTLEKYNLNPDKVLGRGIYFLDLSKNDKNSYIILIIGNGRSGDKGEERRYNHNLVNWDIYFIGDKNIKLSNKLKHKLEMYEEEYNKNSSYYYIYDAYTAEYSDSLSPKSFDNMVFTDKNKILMYINNWIDNLHIYEKYEIIPKLSILIYGPPGTGKTTFALALAKMLNLTRIMYTPAECFSSSTRSDTYYNAGVILMDDIDTYANNRDDDTSIQNKNIVSKILKFLDNPPAAYIVGRDGKRHKVQIVVATTNYYDKLDSAVKRHGRFDLHFEMKYFDKEEAIEFCNLYDLELGNICPKANNKNFRISPAELQALCISNIDKRIKSKES